MAGSAEMKACIVGHGPSMMSAFNGEEIDKHDVVIRLKKSQDLTDRPGLYGSKTDVVLGSVVVAPQLIGDWSDEYWLFVDTRTFHLTDYDLEAIRRSLLPKKCVINRELCEKWVKHYREIRGLIELDERQENKGHLSDDKGHLHCSAGMFAIVHALDIISPEILTIYGFDNIYSGNFHWSVTRGPEWKQYPDHSWETEKRMIYDVADHYGYDLIKKDFGVLHLNKSGEAA